VLWAGSDLGQRAKDDLEAARRLNPGSGWQEPSGQIGAVPATSTRSPTRSARLKPTTGS
jgi:hypothetical protein